MKKGLMVLVGLVFVILIILRILSVNSENIKKQSQKKDEVVLQKKGEDLNLGEVFNINKSSDSIKVLEKKDKELTGSEVDSVKESLNQALTYIQNQENQSDIEVNYDNRLSITRLSMAQTIKVMMGAGYSYDESSVKVYESKSDNVYQFIFNLKKESDNTELSYVGNYVVGTKQLEIVNMFGVPTDVFNG